MKFCSECGQPVRIKIPSGDNRPRHVCGSCQTIHYVNPKIVTGTLPVWEDQVLLCKRAIEPRYGLWTLPAGFMEYDESPEQCAVRESKEELGVDVELDGLFGVYSGKDDPRTHAVLVMYWAKITGGQLKPGDDASEIELFAKNEVPTNIAFLAHRQIIKEFFEIRESE